MKPVHDVTHVTETIDPVLAAKYLEQNDLNRPINLAHVRALAADMEAGRWLETGEAGLSFDTDNSLADGQHTLHAVIRSGATIRLRVTRGVRPEARSAMNDSLKQRFNHDLHIQGINSSVRVEALLRKVLVWENAAEDNPMGLGGLSKWQAARFSRAELASRWPKYANGIVDSVQKCYRWKEEWSLVGNAGALEFMYWLLVHKNDCNPATVTDFFDRMASGSQDEEDKVLTRVKLRMKRKPNGAPHQTYWMCRAWNAWTQDKRLSKLQLPDGGELTDPFPRLQKAR